jgi:hypothetical protein
MSHENFGKKLLLASGKKLNELLNDDSLKICNNADLL